jgi:Flp pilus assembly protein TadG
MMRGVLRRLGRLRRDQRGVAAVEFGLISPIFFGLLVGIIDVGRYMWTLNTIQYAIDQGVRAGVVEQLTEQEVEDLVKSSLAGLKGGTVEVNATLGASTLEVTASTNYAFLFPLSMAASSTTISARSEMPW